MKVVLKEINYSLIKIILFVISVVCKKKNE